MPRTFEVRGTLYNPRGLKISERNLTFKIRNKFMFKLNFKLAIFKLLFCLTIILLTARFDLLAQSFLPVYQNGSGEFETDLTIGGDVEDEDYLLVGPSKIVVDSGGNIFVLDSRENCIKKYDAKGNFLKTVSSAGKGPGEIMTCYQMSIDPKNNIVTYDLGNRRFSFFNNEGVFLHSIPFNDIVWNFKISPDNKYYVETHKWDFGGKAGGALYKISQFSPDFKKESLVDSARIKDNTFITKPHRTNVPVPFHPILTWDISPVGNVVVAYSGDYTIKIFSPDLKLLNKYQGDGKAVKVTAGDKENYFGGMTTSQGGQVEKGAPDFIRKATKFPKYKPFFMGITIDHEGYILIRTYKTENNNGYFDIFNQDGKLINQVKLPVAFGASTFKNGFLYGIRATEDGFPSICRYRLK